MKYARTLPLVALLVLAACRDSPSEPGRVVGGVNLDLLFATPSAAERQAVEMEWAARSHSAAQVQIERDIAVPLGTTPGRVRIVSHVVDGNRHFGAIVAPLNATTASLPVLVYAHGGEAGVSLEELFLAVTATGLNPAGYVFVVPAFRSETLRYGSDSFQSQGEPSPWDRDVDDALSLIDVALANTPAADPARIVVLGVSRGAAVALLMSIRDPRIDAVIEYFGPTDFFDEWVQDIAEDALRGNPPDLPGVNYLNTRFLQPLRQGTITMDAVRRELIRRSAVLFASRIADLQIHHGTLDDVVAVSQAESLIRAMQSLGRQPPDFESYLYAGGIHNPLTLFGALPRTRSFIERY
jgi:dipeptidyl aminopeptidase/acylaminoacyl peptidase